MSWYQKLLIIIKEYQLAAALVGAIVAISIVYINHKLQPKPNVPGIAIISKTGSLLYKSDFDKFGIYSEKKYENGEPYYIITFNREPDYFEVTTQEAAIREIKQFKIGQYKITFLRLLSGGFGAPSSEVIECDFRIQAFKIN